MTVKVNDDLFSTFVFSAFNKCVIFCKFLSVLKLTDATPVHEKIKAWKTEAVVQTCSVKKVFL